MYVCMIYIYDEHINIYIHIYIYVLAEVLRYIDSTLTPHSLFFAAGCTTLQL